METAPDGIDGPDTAGRLVRGGALRFVSYAGTTLLAIVSAAALTRHLGRGSFGVYTTVLSLTVITAVVTDSGMSQVGIREYSVLEGARREALLRQLLGLRVVLTLAGVVIVVVWSLAAGYSTAVLVGGIGASLANVALIFQHTLVIPLSADLRLGTLSAIEFARQAATVAGIVVLVALGAGLGPLLAVTLLSNTLLIVPAWLLVRGQISLRPSVNVCEWLALLRPTVVYSLAAAVGTIYIYTAQILTGFVTSRDQSGLFALSFRVFIATASVPGLLVSSALPVLSRAAQNDRERLRYVLQRIFEASLITGVGAALALSAGAGFVIDVVNHHHGFGRAVPVLELQAWALIPSFLIANWSYGLLSLHRHRALVFTNLAAFVVSVGLTLGLAHALGARGAAWATIGGETTLALGSLIALAASGREYQPNLTVVLKVVIAGGIAAAAAFLPDLSSLVRTLVAIAVYGAAILLLRALPPEFRALLPGRHR